MRHDFAERSSMSDACCVDRLIDIFLANRVVGSPNRARQEATIDANIDPNPSRKRLPGTPNRSEIDPRTTPGRPGASKSVQRASREYPGRVSGHPRWVPEPPRPPLDTTGRPEISWDRFRVDVGCPGASFGKDLDRCSRRLSPLGRLDLASQRHD